MQSWESIAELERKQDRFHIDQAFIYMQCSGTRGFSKHVPNLLNLAAGCAASRGACRIAKHHMAEEVHSLEDRVEQLDRGLAGQQHDGLQKAHSALLL